MKTIRILLITVITFAVSFLVITAPTVYGGDINVLHHDVYDQVMRGGKLYDKWYAEHSLNLKDSHPSYPAEGKKKGASTWRCKECHGWDYRGKNGAYAKGSHFSGIKGIRAYAGKNPGVIEAILRNNTHAFGNALSDDDYRALSFFVAYGQIDMSAHIDSVSKKVGGDKRNGARIYASTCTKCHGADGRKINFKTPEQPEYVGTIANKNPWEALHKIRFGQPASEMINLLFLDIKDQMDVLAYTQTLPVK
jgi:thiosulfate dehydrogenase